MASEYYQKHTVPNEFPLILRNFTREVLRLQPKNIVEFSAKYFRSLVDKKPLEWDESLSRGPLPCDYPRVNIPKNLRVLPTTEQPQPYVSKKGGNTIQDGKTAKPVEDKVKSTKVESKDSHAVQHDKAVKVTHDKIESHEKPGLQEKNTPKESERGEHFSTHAGAEVHHKEVIHSSVVADAHKNEEHITKEHKPVEHKGEKDKVEEHKIVEHKTEGQNHEEHAIVEHKHEEHTHIEYKHEEHTATGHIHEEHTITEHKHEEHKHEEHTTTEYKHEEHQHEEHKHEDHKHEEHKHEEHKHEEHKHEEHQLEEHKHEKHQHEEHKHEEHKHEEHKPEEHKHEDTHHSEEVTRHPAPKHTHKSSIGDSSARDALNISGNISLPSNPEDAAEAYVENLIEKSENNIVNT